MTGSEKQIKWAEGIKSTKINGWRFNRKGDTPDTWADYDSAISTLAAIESAKWWIDNRHMPMASPELVTPMFRKEAFAAEFDKRMNA